MTDNKELSELAKRLGKRGGDATKAKHGTKHFSNAGKLGMARRWAKKKSDSKQPDGDSKTKDKH